MQRRRRRRRRGEPDIIGAVGPLMMLQNVWGCALSRYFFRQISKYIEDSVDVFYGTQGLKSIYNSKNNRFQALSPIKNVHRIFQKHLNLSKKTKKVFPAHDGWLGTMSRTACLNSTIYLKIFIFLGMTGFKEGKKCLLLFAGIILTLWTTQSEGLNLDHLQPS